MTVCPNPENCCKELTRVWAALGVKTYVPGMGSCSEQVAALKAEVEALREMRATLQQGLPVPR